MAYFLRLDGYFMYIMTVLLDAPGDLHFMRLAQAGVVAKFEGISCFVKEYEVVSGKCLDHLLARGVSVVVYFLG